MANTVQLQFTIFQNLDSAGQRIGQKRYGYRIFDQDDAQYNNTFDSLEQMQAAGLTQEGIYEYIEDKHPLFAEAAFYGGVLFNGQYIMPPDIDDGSERTVQP